MEWIKERYLSNLLGQKYNELIKQAKGFTENETEQLKFIVSNSGLNESDQTKTINTLKGIDFDPAVRAEISEQVRTPEDITNEKNEILNSVFSKSKSNYPSAAENVFRDFSDPYGKALEIANIPSQVAPSVILSAMGEDKPITESSYIDVIAKATGQGDNPNLPTKIVGLGADILIDPIGLLTGGLSKATKAKKVYDILKGAEVLTKLDDAADIAKLISKTDDVILGLSKSAVKYATDKDRAKAAKILVWAKNELKHIDPKSLLKEISKDADLIKAVQIAPDKIADLAKPNRAMQAKEELVDFAKATGERTVGGEIKPQALSALEKAKPEKISKLSALKDDLKTMFISDDVPLENFADTVKTRKGKKIVERVIDTRAVDNATDDIARIADNPAAIFEAGTKEARLADDMDNAGKVAFDGLADINKAGSVNKAKQAESNLKEVIDFEADKMRGILSTLAKKRNLNAWKTEYQKLNDDIIEAIETGTVKNLDQDAQKVAEYFQTQMGKVYQYEKVINPDIKLFEKYVPRITERGEDLSDTVKFITPGQSGARAAGDLTIRQINVQNKLDKSRQALITDLPTLLKLRKDKTLKSFVNFNVQEKVKPLISKIKKAGDIEIPSHPTFNPGNKKLYINAKVYEKIKPILELTPAEIKIGDKFYNYLKNGTEVWKSWQLALSPTYHLNNMIDNLWKLFAMDINPKRLLDAGKVQRGNKFAIVAKNGKMLPVDIPILKRLGIIGGQYGKDIEILKHLDTNKSALKSLMVDNPLIKTGFKIGAYLEDGQRIAGFLDRLEKIGDYQKAADDFRKFFFSYENLTDFEKKVMKIGIPFYAFMRRNLPTSARILLTKPHKQAVFVKIKNAAEKGQDNIPAEFQDDSLKSTFKIKVGTDREKGIEKYMPVGGMFSFLQLGELINGGLNVNKLRDFILKQSNPLLKEGFSQLFNVDPNTGKPIAEWESLGIKDSETTVYMGMKLPKRLVHAMKNAAFFARVAGMMEKVNPGSIFGNKEQLSVFGETSGKSEKDLMKTMLSFFVSTDFNYDMERSYNKAITAIHQKKGAVNREIRKRVSLRSMTQSGDVKQKYWNEILELKELFKELGAEEQELKRAFFDAKKELNSGGAK